MNAVIRCTSSCFLLGVMLMAGVSHAQSQSTDFWTRDTLNNLSVRHSAAAYTPDRIQRRLINSSIPQYNFGASNYRGLFNPAWGGSPGTGKRFSGIASPGAVTPYLSLSEPFSSSAHNYYTQVRPQLDQQRFNQQAAMRARQLQQQVASLEAQAPFSPVGDQQRAPTGHAAVFMNLGGYFPAMAPARR